MAGFIGSPAMNLVGVFHVLSTVSAHMVDPIPADGRQTTFGAATGPR